MAFEVPPGSGGQYFSLKLQRVKHHLRHAQGPGLPSAVPQGFWFLNATLPKILEIQGASDCGLSAGSPVGTVMPYLLLMGKGAFLSSMVDILERLRRSRWRWDGSWILLFTRLGIFRPLRLGTPRPSVSLSSGDRGGIQACSLAQFCSS